MKLTINGEEREVSGTTIAELLGELKVIPERVAVEVNLTIIKRAEFGRFALREGDVVEVVNFVGGGGAWKIH